ncbi:TA system toxin CbtA family protein [Photorhabdus sp. SF281]
MFKYYNLVWIDRRGFSGQDQGPWLTPLDVYRASPALGRNVHNPTN